jgi:hypothetical protein
MPLPGVSERQRRDRRGKPTLKIGLRQGCGGRDVRGGYEFGLDTAEAAPDWIWKQTPKPVQLGDRPQGEGVSYGRDGLTLYASSEKRNAPLFMIKRK